MMDNNVTAPVFNIQKFSLHDGPGIRTLVFFKGCPLRCQWCANPEGLEALPQLMVDEERCTHCSACQNKCSSLGLDPNHCQSCGECVSVCPVGARKVVGKVMDVDEVFSIVKRDSPFYQFSGGGVTLGGGEPLLYPHFAYELLKRCHDEGISTAIETSGYFNWESIEKIVPYIDWLLFDIKHFDSQKHKAWTGKENGLILSNLKKFLMAKKGEIIIRLPLIHGVNDDLQMWQQFLHTLEKWLDSIQKPSFHLLPYHQLGIGKYQQLGMEYRFTHAEKPSTTFLDGLRQMLLSLGFSVTLYQI